MAIHRYCDGVRRRDFLKAGLVGGMGLTLANYLQLSQAGEIANGKAKAAIFVSLGGGPSHMDTFDLKPNSPSEYRGELNPIATNVSGIEICEHLPKLAQTADKFAILRGVSAIRWPPTSWERSISIPGTALSRRWSIPVTARS